MPPRPAQPYPSPLAPAVFHPGRLLLIAAALTLLGWILIEYQT